MNRSLLDRLREDRRWIVPAALLALLVVAYPEPVLRGWVFASADSTNALGFTLVGNAALATGHYPLWNPFLFLGMPTFGSLSYTRFVYPPGELLTFLQDHLGFPPLTWLLAHLLFGGLGMAWLLGRWRLRPAARLLGAALWMLAPKVTAWAAYGHGSKLATAMYLPWVAGLCLDLLDGRRRRAAPLLALLLGLEILRGHIQIIYYTGLLLVLLWLGRLVTVRRMSALERRGFLHNSLLLLAALVLAGGIGSVLLWPVHEYAGWSVRGSGPTGGASYDYATGWSLSPREWDTLLVPSAAGFGKGTYQGSMPFTDYPNYLGLLALGLAATALWRRRGWETVTLAVAAVAALLVAAGRHFPPLYDVCYHFLPMFNRFRVPSMILVLTVFATAVLAAIGLEHWATSPVARARRPALVLGGIGVALLLGAALGHDGYVGHLAAMARRFQRPAPGGTTLELAWLLQRADLVRIGVLLLATGLWWWRLAPRGGRWRAAAVWLVTLAVATDLLVVDRRIVHPERYLKEVSRSATGGGRLVDATPLLHPARGADPVAVDPVWTEVAAVAGHDRVWPLGVGNANEGMLAGVRSLGGYHPAKPAAAEAVRKRLFDPRRPAGRLACWLAGRLLLVDRPLGQAAFTALDQLGAPVAPDPVVRDGLLAYRIRDALPRARLVTRWRGDPPDLDAILDGVADDRWPWRTTVHLEEAPEPAPAATDTVLPPVTFVADELDRVVLRAAPPVPALLVLADQWLPGWRVTVDGRPARLLRADRLLRAVALPAGEHTVEFRYHDPGLGTALPAALAALLLALAWLVAGRPRPAPVAVPETTEARKA